MSVFKYAGAALVIGLFSQAASAACFVIYSQDRQVIYRDIQPPLDMSYQFHITLPQLVPGSTLVFTPEDNVCARVNKLPVFGNTLPQRPARRDRG
jgi:hypothetical protein